MLKLREAFSELAVKTGEVKSFRVQFFDEENQGQSGHRTYPIYKSVPNAVNWKPGEPTAIDEQIGVTIALPTMSITIFWS